MKVIYQYNFFQYLEFQALAHYLETMAKKGWILEKIGYVLKFRKQEPQDLQYVVDFQPKITLFTPQNSEESKEYQAFCEESGWKFVCGFNKMQIFCANRKDHLIPIQTEEQIQYKVLEKSALPPLLATILVFLYCGFLLYKVLSSDSSIIHPEDDLLTLLFLIFIPLLSAGLIELTRASYLLLNNQRRIKNGLSMKFTPYHRVLWYHRIEKIMCVLLLLSFFVPIFFTKYPEFYLYNNAIVLSFALAGPLLGVLLVLIREHSKLNKEVFLLLILITIPCCLLITELLDSHMNFNTQKLSFLQKQEPFYASLSQHIKSKDNWTVEHSSTSYAVPIKYNMTYATYHDATSWYPEDLMDYIHIDYAEYKDSQMAEKEFKKRLIDTYTYDHGYLKEWSDRAEWIYASVPDDTTLYDAYPSLDHSEWHITNGYQTKDKTYLIWKNQRVYHITYEFEDNEKQRELQEIIKAYFTQEGL